MCSGKGGAEGLLKRKLCPGAHKAHHHLVCAHGVPQVDVAHKALMAGLVVYAGAHLFQQAARGVQNGGKNGRLQPAALAGHHTVAARGVKPGADMPFAVAAKRVLRLVAVTLSRRRGKNGQNLAGKFANAVHGVGHKALFLRKLFFIGKVGQRTAAAFAEHRAFGGNAPGARCYHILYNGECVCFAHLYNFGIHHIARRGKGHEHGHAAGVGHAGTVRGERFDGKLHSAVLLKACVLHGPS